MKNHIKKKAFTLIELMITILIVGILMIIAITLTSSQTLKGRRIDAINVILSISLAEERYRSTHTTYGTLAQTWNNITVSPEGYYTLDISNISATTYTITATATGNQVNDQTNGISCTPLQLAVNNGTITKSPAVCWPT